MIMLSDHPAPARALAVLAGAATAVSCLGAPAAAAEPPANPYANGTAITLAQPADPANGKYDFTGNDVYGGGNGVTPPLTSTDLTVDDTARAHHIVYAGNQAGALNGTAKLTYNGKRPDLTSSAATGYQAYFLYGGGGTGSTHTAAQATNVTMNDGWVRGWILGGGQGPITGDTRVTMSGGLIGPPIASTETVGQAEIYGGGINAGGTVKGDTYVTVKGEVYDAATYKAGDPVTLVRQHVLGGGSSGAVVTGDSHVSIEGGTVEGMVLGGPGGGGVANNLIGDTHVSVTGGVLSTRAGSTRGGSVYGGGYAASQNVTGNTNVSIGTGANILGGVYGGGYAGPYSIQGNTVSGNADTVVLGGHIGTNIYAGGAGTSRVNGTSTVHLRQIKPGSRFADEFTRSVLRGGIGTGGTAETRFEGYTADYKGAIGATNTGQMDGIRFVDASHLRVTPAKYHGRNWTIQKGSTVDVAAAGTMSSVSFTNAGLLTLNSAAAPENLHSTIGGDYRSDGGTLAMSATTDTAKNFLTIDKAAKLATGRSARARVRAGAPTTIDLKLAPSWDGHRIDLVTSADPSDAGAFTMTPIPVNNADFHGNAVLRHETNAKGGITWYIEGEPTPLYTVTVHHGTLPGGLAHDTFHPGAHVAVTATVPAGRRFTHWVVDSGGPLAGIDLRAARTSFTMPHNDVVLTAHFAPIPAGYLRLEKRIKDPRGVRTRPVTITARCAGGARTTLEVPAFRTGLFRGKPLDLPKAVRCTVTETADGAAGPVRATSVHQVNGGRARPGRTVTVTAGGKHRTAVRFTDTYKAKGLKD
ncbi:InlB B-repeat-containing protein [Actinomadura parmotrematis]|uniref:Bacterial repeat domain-containing protein n=1 Tax=Actinomadura parmotrematis TaxID=2864039 RepID=A0ABS7FPD8_9ACTN|nr:hypothetical protein [Actinomadura parmotrematis]MBW8482171.1 hypothetical protein [Actinomadura parmotrematis]